jgi:hypothetical protein
MTAASTAPPAPAGSLPNPCERFGSHKNFTAPVSTAIGKDPQLREVAAAIGNCAQVLDLLIEQPPDQPLYAHLNGARVCNRRLCPWCEWRRSLRWKRRIERGLNLLAESNPSHRPVLLTLTVRNCELEALGETIEHLHRSWKRLQERSFFPTDLWLRRTEVTFPARLPTDICRPQTAADADPGSVPLGGRMAHPHVHALLMVRPSYFSHGYVKQTAWQQEWWDAARLDYCPVVDVRAITTAASRRWDGDVYKAAAQEVGKYICKATDYLGVKDRLPEVHRQLAHHRLIACSQPLRAFISDAEPQGDELTDQPLHLRDPDSELSPARAEWNAFAREYWVTPTEGAA